MEEKKKKKKIKGRKRHIVVDIMGNLLGVVVHAANLHDTTSGIYAAAYASTIYPTIQGYCEDAGYRGTFVEEVRDMLDLPVDIVARKDNDRWEVLPKRWIVERTFAWLEHLSVETVLSSTMRLETGEKNAVFPLCCGHLGLLSGRAFVDFQSLNAIEPGQRRPW